MEDLFITDPGGEFRHGVERVYVPVESGILEIHQLEAKGKKIRGCSLYINNKEYKYFVGAYPNSRLLYYNGVIGKIPIEIKTGLIVTIRLELFPDDFEGSNF